MNVWGHVKTITHHRFLVMKGCFAVGLYRQGLLHDLSKYSPTEFLPGCKYYQGTKSPNNAERADRGYSAAWLHHKGRNKHHLEYWIDYSSDEDKTQSGHGVLCGMKMPVRYVCEMFIDRVSASKTYQKDAYTDQSPLKYYQEGKDAYLLHPDTRALLEYLLKMLSVRGEEKTYSYIRRVIVPGRFPYEKKKLDRAAARFG